MSPVLLGGVALLLGALFIGFKLIQPSLEKSLEKSKEQSAVGLQDARKRMVDSATRMVEKRSGRNLQNKLEQSGSQLRSGEWALIVGAVSLLLGGVGFLVRGLPALFIASLVVPIVARSLLNRRIRKRQHKFADQLPDFLQNLSSSLRAGQSLTQSIAAMAPDMESPAGDELRRVVIENRIGRDLIESFKDLAARMESLDFDWVVRAIEINYRTGGDLSVILRRLDATIRARNQVAGQVRALTAEGRISAVVLTALPPGLMLVVWLLNPEFLDPLFQSIMGQAMLVIACVQLLIGSFWLSRMARFKF